MLISNVSFTQDSTIKPRLQTIGKLDLSLHGIGATIEQPLFQKILVEATFGVGGGYYKVNNWNFFNVITYDWEFIKPVFYTNINLNFFYNRKPWLKKNKSILLNTGDFITVGTKYTSPRETDKFSFKKTFIAYAHIGLKRSLGNKITFQTFIGGGYAWLPNEADSGFYPSFDTKLSYVLFKK